MKQKKLVQELYNACLKGDKAREEELRKKEFEKILKHKAKGKPFGPKWTVVR